MKTQGDHRRAAEDRHGHSTQRRASNETTQARAAQEASAADYRRHRERHCRGTRL